MLQITISVFVFCFILEKLFAGWKLPKVHTWYTRVVLINVIQLAIITLAGFTWEKWLNAKSMLHLSANLNPWAAGFIAYFIATFVFYWWHRLRHQSDFFWRQFHQIHHSPQRLEVITSFYKHPHEMIVNSVLGSLLVYSLLGLSIQAGAIYTLFTALGEFFYHTNVKTPRWVGYIFQRPEMHRIHHQYNYHRNNYGDFVIWDMIFGTYENPKTWSDRCGFDEAKELKLKDMLLLKDVHKIFFAAIAFGLITTPHTVFAADQKFQSWEEACGSAESAVAEGDLIFVDIPSILFRTVAESTQTWTSHVGVALKDPRGRWIVSESKVPFSTSVPLCTYLKSSSEYLFEIKRLNRPLTSPEIDHMKTVANSLMGRRYEFGFDFNSRGMFCSKFAFLLYQSIGVKIGTVQTFKELLAQNPKTSISFWKVWFLGSIPWDRQTITPGSQLNDPKLFTVLKGS